MFDLGIQELIVIFVVALLVFGPKRLPEIGRTLGKGLGELKRSMQGVKEQMDTELRDIRQPVSLDTILNPTPEAPKKTETPPPADPYAGTAAGEAQAPPAGPGQQGEAGKAGAGKDAEKGSEKGLKG